MSNKIKTVIVVAIISILAMSAWQFVRNNRLDEEIKALEIQRTLKQKEIDELQAQVKIREDALDKIKADYTEQSATLHEENSNLQTKIHEAAAKKTEQDKTISKLKDQIASIPETPPEVAEKYCPELPVLKQLNSQLEAKIGTQAIEISLRDSLIANKDKEIMLLGGVIDEYQATYDKRSKLIDSLKDQVKLGEEEIGAYKKKDSFKWLPKFSAGVAITCDVVGSRGCVAGPSIQLGWRF